MLTLDPMTEAEYAQFDATLWTDYAAERARNLRTSVEYERESGQRQRAELLPDGMHTANHHFWNMVDADAGVVGKLWVFVDGEKQRAYIYDIVVDAAHRRKGYARQALAALDQFVRPLGITHIGLNVFGDNPGAKSLYEQMGYYTVATMMQKDVR